MSVGGESLQEDALERLRNIAADEAALLERKQIAVKYARSNGVTRGRIADALGISTAQVDYLDNSTPAIAQKRARPSRAVELPGVSVTRFAANSGLTRDAIYRRIRSGTLKAQEVSVGRRTVFRILVG